jgi:hypothetical protein
MAGMRALGRLFDIGTAFAPVDLNTAAVTGKRINMATCTGVTFLLSLGAAGSGVEDVVLTFKQHTAYTSGTSNNLAAATVTTSSGITAWWMKAEATLDNDEIWVETTQADSATVTIGGTVNSAFQCQVAVYVSADQLGDGYTHVSVDVGDVGSVARLSNGIYIAHDLAVQRAPVRLPNLLRPGTANA